LASSDTADHPEPTRRDFLYIATGAVLGVGATLTAWPLIDQMNPDASALALASIEVDISSITPGMSLTVKWRGKPVFIRNRTPEEIEAAKATPLSELKDQAARNANLPDDALATDENRSASVVLGGGPEGGAAAPAGENWLIQVGVCTHLGCIPLGQQGPYGGWFCPCHGSAYDTAGRIRSGPAPENLAVPVYAFTNDTTIRIG
jgi:ubiquinol-cytochrome c reductase iron-sulfur subunit